MNSITVFGIFVADLCFFSNSIPQKGQSILGSKHLVGPGGKGSNQAIAAAKLNGEVHFITKLGDDQYSKMAISHYNDSGVKINSLAQDSTLSTGVAGIMINEITGDNIINVIPGAASYITNQDVDKNIDILKKSKIFPTQLEIPSKVTSYAIKKAKELGCVVILNPAPAREIKNSDYKNIDFFTPNEKEASFYLKKNIESDTDIKMASSKFLKMGIKNVILTLGSRGIYFANKDDSYFLPALDLKGKVVDTTGAGDAFNGAFSVALSKNFSYKDALIFANKVAGISTTKLGAAKSMPTLNEVNNY